MSGRFTLLTFFGLVFAVVLLFAVYFWPLGRAKPDGFCSGDGWCWQNPLPQGNTLNAVHFVDDDYGWVAGRYGTMIVTTDGGQTWSQQDIGTQNSLRTVGFKNRLQGWAGGYGYDSEKRLLYTSNGGITWQSAGEFDERFEGSTFVDNVGFLAGISIGAAGRVRKLAEGAADWELSYAGEQNTALRALDFLDPLTGWVVGWDGIILHTTDGGSSWIRQQNLENPDQLDLNEVILFDIDAVDASNVWGVGRYPLTVFHSVNGGETWTAKATKSLTIIDYPPNYPPTLFKFNTIHFTDQQHGWAAGGAWLTGAIFRTADGGETWEEQTGWPLEAFGSSMSSSNMSSYGIELQFYDIIFTPDAGKAWAVGTGGAVFHSPNGGDTWTEQSYSRTRVYLRAVGFFDDEEGLAAGHNGVLLRTVDGDSWDLDRPEIDGWCHYRTLALSGSSVWLVGYGNPDSDGEEGGTQIFRSNDRGHDWIEQTSIMDSTGSPLELQGIRLETVSFIDEQVGWIAGQDGIILHTNNGGDRWNQLETGIEGDISSIFFVNEHLGWAASENLVFITLDGGHYWEPRYLETSEGITDLEFLDHNVGWAIGYGKIFHTVDGGETWQVQFSVSACAFRGQSIAILDENNIWISEGAGRVLHTSDGGINWIYEDTGTNNPLDGIAVNSRNEVWAVGYLGSILHKDYTDKSHEQSSSGKSGELARCIAIGGEIEQFDRNILSNHTLIE